MYKGIVVLIAISSVLCIQRCNQRGKKNQYTRADTGFGFKNKLSEYGFFRGKLNELNPIARLVNYELSTPLFTDYTVKDRFIFLPKNRSAKYAGAGLLDFPDSTIIVKNFAYTNELHVKIMIETRMLAKDPADHQWKVMNYLWNKEQTDAVRHIVGARLPVTLLDDSGNKISTVYQVPNTNDCKRCHVNNRSLTPIGLKARNLNFVREVETVNQLEHLARLGVVQGLPPLDNVDVLPDWKDGKHFTLDQRARAYLDINCAHCHSTSGDAANTGLFLEYEQTDLNHLGVMKGPVSAGGGAGGLNYNIIPGDASHSIIAHRMNSVEPGTAMPELARTIIHREGVRLIIDWINQMHVNKAIEK
jgi:uncharacterized repeat protein (TIGR03806 family)